jgi:protein TonB
MRYSENSELMAQRLLSGALSCVFSVGMVLALASLSGAGGRKAEKRNLLVAMDLSQAGEEASADSAPTEPQEAPPQATAKQKIAAAPPPPMLQLGHEPAAQPPPTDRPVDLAPPSPDIGAAAKPLPVAPVSPSVPARSHSAAPPASDARPVRAAASGHPGAGYKGEVWRHLQRFRSANVVGPGAAFVSFTIGGGGHVDALGIARSSGSKRFDGEALQMVRRAQPFPPPPPDEPGTFIFEIKGS